ncbi:DUF6177 family protein [Streptomyces sp. NBC_00006]|uniref:DUF6177 family protein n=1 Tax=Streptomyces sp. NBC_00006 TaxID=2975619 RepID=UPI00224E79B3|nr:DUF6177 family protein [Streptomyces sp. NBC_00006]MCX5529797.1 DUF6177 family protein [Streptomyces sp. NBC_00006]
MTQDIIALTPKMPDPAALLAALHAGGPDLTLTTTDDDAVIHLCTPEGRPLVSVEAPVLVHAEGEAERLLGPEVGAPEPPFWWTELRASTAAPEAKPLAATVAARLTMLLGGTTWPRDTHTTAVVEPSEPPPDANTPTPAATDTLPIVDVLTDSTAVVIADRPILGLTTWLADVLRITTAANRALHIVTPPHTRLTLPLRTALGGAPNRWVIQHPEDGYYDGLSGAELTWREGTFTPTGDGTLAAPLTTGAAAPAHEHQLTVSFRTLHAPVADLTLGASLETAWRHLLGTPPAGWGTAEPINLPWSPRQLTDLARDRAPEPTHTLAIGAPDCPAIATHRTTRTTTGITEDITLTVGYGADETAPLDAIEPLAAELVATHNLATMLTTLRTARADLTLPPLLTAPPVPVAFTLGAAEVGAIGLTYARRPPFAIKPVQLGTAAAPSLHYPLGDGTSADAWASLHTLTSHLKSRTIMGSST